MNIRFFSRIMLCGTLASGIPVMNQALAAKDSAPIQIDSQTIKVTGIVKDNTGPIIGASLSAINLENQGFAKLVHENVHETPQISILGAFFCV